MPTDARRRRRRSAAVLASLTTGTVAIGAGALPLVLGQGTAFADGGASKDLEFTFVRNGQEISCTVHGSSQHTYFADTDTTLLRGDTNVDPEEPGCAENVVALSVIATWAPEPGGPRTRVAIGRSEGGTVATVFANDEGRTGSIVVEHEVLFECDPGLCQAKLTTTPK
jgi:hypothetical protein